MPLVLCALPFAAWNGWVAGQLWPTTWSNKFEPVTQAGPTLAVLSDGEDTSSHKDYDEVMALSKRSDVIVFAIAVKTNAEPVRPGWNEAEFVLRTLAQETGGRVFPLTDFSTLASIYAQITDDLASQYTIGYRSKNQRHDGLWRRVVVQVPQGGVTARTKSGYFAPTKAR